MPNPTAAMIVIGDEILSGRTRDSNMNYLAIALQEVGIDLKEARIIADDPKAITDTVNALRHTYDHVFTSGGIGPTHDDITAEYVAAAFGLDIGIRQDAFDLLEAYYKTQGREFNAARQRMARIPEGAVFIDNPVSVAPGFSLGNVHVMAGVPSIFQAMLAGLLPKLTGGKARLVRSVEIHKGEGDFADTLAKIAQDFPQISIGSYPFMRDGNHGANIVLRGDDASDLDRAVARLQNI